MFKPFENLGIKMLALAMGLLLWFHVATEKKYTYRFTLPISDVVLGEGLTLAEAPPDSAVVLVSSRGKQLIRRKWRERGVRILATQLSSGIHTMNLNPSNTFLVGAGEHVSLEEVVSPTSLRLHIDYISEAKVKVISNLNILPDEGFAVSHVSDPQPPEVTLRGARIQVRKINAVTTESRTLTGLRDNITVKLALVTPPGYKMSLEPDSVSIAVEVVAVKTREFRNIPIVVYNAPPEKIVTTEPSTIDVELTGPPEDIDILNRIALVASTDFRQMDSNGFSPVTIDCPTNFKVKKVSANKVKIRVE